MGQVKIKFGKIRDTLDNFDICKDDKEIIDELLDLEKQLRDVYEYAKLVDQYGEETRKTVLTVMRADEEISRLFNLSAIDPVERLDKKIVELANKVCTKANMIKDALDIIKTMTNLEKDPVWEIVQMIYHAEFNNDADELRKLLKRHVLKVIAESPEKVDIDYDKLLDEDVSDEERGEPCAPVTVNMVVGIRSIFADSDGLNKNIYWDDGVVKAEVIRKGNISYLKLVKLDYGVESKIFEFRIKRKPIGGSTAAKQVAVAQNLVNFINEVSSLESCSGVDANILINKYGVESALFRPEPEDDKNQLFEECDRLSIYVDILVDFNTMEFKVARASVFAEGAYKNGYNGKHYLDHEISSVEDFESEFNPVKIFANMQPLVLSDM